MRSVDQASHVLSYGMPHLTHITTIDFGPLDSTHQQMPPNHPAFIMSISQQIINTQHGFQGVFRPAPPAHHHEETKISIDFNHWDFLHLRHWAFQRLYPPCSSHSLWQWHHHLLKLPGKFENSSWEIPSRELT